MKPLMTVQGSHLQPELSLTALIKGKIHTQQPGCDLQFSDFKLTFINTVYCHWLMVSCFTHNAFCLPARSGTMGFNPCFLCTYRERWSSVLILQSVQLSHFLICTLCSNTQRSKASAFMLITPSTLLWS